MAEGSDYSPGDWAGYDFTAARAAYDVHANRAYTAAVQENKRAADMVPAKLTTDSPAPLVVLCDVTGSMGDWPAIIFSKLPYLDNECKEYLGPDYEVSFAATADVNDSYPLQVRPFAKGRDLETQLKEFIIGGGSGPESAHEAYELSALYYAENVEMPNAEHPILIYIADEHFHDTIDEGFAKTAHISIEGSRNTYDIFSKLREKYAVYVVRKPYSGEDAEINKEWTNALGDDHLIMLDGPERVVDVIFGILAKETDKITYFQQEIEGRQRVDQVKTVYKALETIHLLDAGTPAKKGASKLHKSIKGKTTKRLLP